MPVIPEFIHGGSFKIRTLLICGVIAFIAIFLKVTSWNGDKGWPEPPTLKAPEVCYDDLGCFSVENPWTAFARIGLLPDTPSKINTQFLLYTRNNSGHPMALRAGDIAGLEKSSFNGSRPTKFIVHGYIDSGNHPWLGTMAERFVAFEDVNVFAVDWQGGSVHLYTQAVANTRVVGAEIAKMIKFLRKETDLKLSDVHVIGHSLGAHIASYVGHHVDGKIGHITGLDPADPYFQFQDPLVRLDEGDADFVDVLHTDAGYLYRTLMFQGGYGTWEASGHVDVYMNGGIEQPGCNDHRHVRTRMTDDVMENFRWIFSCSHCRAYEFMTETIGSKCPWRTYDCSSWEEFSTGRCLRCHSGSKTCNGVGYMAVKPSDGSFHNKYWIATGEQVPFCRYHIHVHLVLSARENVAFEGKLWARLFGENSTSAALQPLITNGNNIISLKPGSSHDFLITLSDDLGKTIQSVEIKWELDQTWPDVMKWQTTTEMPPAVIYLEKVAVFSGEHQSESVFCTSSNDGALQSNSSRILSTRC